MKALIDKEREKIANAQGRNKGDFSVSVALIWRLAELGGNFMISRWRLRRCNKLGRIVFTRHKPKVLNKGEIEIGNLVRIWSNVNRVRLAVGKGARLKIGHNTRINGPTISVSSEVIIGNNCRIAPHVIIMDSDFHDVNDRLSDGKQGRIEIKDGAWVATRAMVLKNVTIGKGAVVASGAVVTKDVPDYCVVGGVPAKVIKRLPQAQQENSKELVLENS